MSSDLDSIITELEEVTAHMVATTCWRQVGEFGDLSASRHALAAQLMDRKDLDPKAAERIHAVIQVGHSLVVRAIAMRESLLVEIAQTEMQQCFIRELANTVPDLVQTNHLDMRA